MVFFWFFYIHTVLNDCMYVLYVIPGVTVIQYVCRLHHSRRGDKDTHADVMIIFVIGVRREPDIGMQDV